MADARVKLTIQGDSKEAQDALAGVTDKLGSLATKILGLVAGFMSFEKLKKLIMDASAAASILETTNIRLAAVFQQTIEQANAYSAELSSITENMVMTDNAARSASIQLALFGATQDTITASLEGFDAAAFATGRDINEITYQMTLLTNPELAMRAKKFFQRMGMDVNEFSVNADGSIKDINEMMTAFSEISMKKWGDKVAEYMDTAAGKTKQLKEVWEDNLEAMGKEINEGLVPAMDLMLSKQNKIGDAMVGLGAIIGGAIHGLAALENELNNVGLSLTALLGPIAGVLDGLAKIGEYKATQATVKETTEGYSQEQLDELNTRIKERWDLEGKDPGKIIREETEKYEKERMERLKAITDATNKLNEAQLKPKEYMPGGDGEKEKSEELTLQEKLQERSNKRREQSIKLLQEEIKKQRELNSTAREIFTEGTEGTAGGAGGAVGEGRTAPSGKGRGKQLGDDMGKAFTSNIPSAASMFSGIFQGRMPNIASIFANVAGDILSSIIGSALGGIFSWLPFASGGVIKAQEGLTVPARPPYGFPVIVGEGKYDELIATASPAGKISADRFFQQRGFGSVAQSQQPINVYANFDGQVLGDYDISVKVDRGNAKSNSYVARVH